MVTIIQAMRKTFIGTSTETKPTTGLDVGDVWRETDTGKTLIWNGSEWKEAAAAAVPWAIGLAGFYVDDAFIADSGIDASLKLKDGSVVTSKLADASITTEKLKDGSVTTSKLVDESVTPSKLQKSTILAELPIVLGTSPRGLDAASTGVKHETANTLIPSWVTSMFSAAYWEVGLLQITGGTIALELYDGTSVIASISLTATTYRTRSTTNILSSIAGKEVRGRLNVTTAGASGSLAGDATYKIVFVR
ncbi:MAG: hypothetical protein QW253_00105 [Metallosphaera sp.]